MARAGCILSLSRTQWSSPYWTSRQFLTYYLSRHARVLYATDRAEFRTLLTLRQKSEPETAPFAPPPGLELVNTPWPRTYRFHRADSVLLDLHVRALQERLDRDRTSRRVLYVWHPVHLTTVERLDYDVLVYHPFDMFRHFSESSDRTVELEDRLCRLADAVITPHHAVAESLGHPRSHVVHNGVFLPAFPDYRSFPAAPQLQGLSRPVVGYLGVINDKIDFRILRDAARARPGWQFVMVGPTRSGAWRDSEAFRAFAGLENTKFLPGVPIDRVAPIMAGFDVGAIPYVLDGWAGYSESPLKLYQYWAMGVPVVASPLPTFVSEPGAIEVGASGGEWVGAIDRLLEARSEGRRSALRQRALGHSWEEKAVQVMSIIDGL